MVKTLTVSSPPHIYGNDTTARRMRDVLIALSPACAIGIYRFGLRAVFVMAVTVIAALLAESFYKRIAHKTNTIGDCSAAVTGLLLALNLPPAIPLWIPALGSFFAIIAVKELFGGIGHNFVNPALAARAFLLVSFPVHMTTWTIPGSAFGVDAVTGATYLALMKMDTSFIPQASDYMNMLLGNRGGCIGEISAIAIILGGIYLFVRKVINWRIPIFYIGSFVLFSYILGRNGLFTGNVLFELLSGGILFGAIFMATDYATSPITPKGKIFFGIGCGFLTVIIRYFGGYPEGVMYSILIMNLFVPAIDKYVRPRIYGKAK